MNVGTRNTLKAISEMLPGFDYESPLCAYFWNLNKTECRTDFDSFSFSLHKEIVDYGINNGLAGAFDGQIVVDLGCGNTLTGNYGSEIASMLGAKACIGLDAFNLYGIEYSENYFSGKCGIPVFLVPEDINSFLRRVPDSSVSTFAAGMDEDILASHDYRALVGEEIKRTVHDNGCFISNLSDITPYGMDVSFIGVGNLYVVKYTKK